MASRPEASANDGVLRQEVSELAMAVARPLIFLDTREPWPKRLCGGSCFILRFDAGLIGVTANHVIDAFEQASAADSNVICLLRTEKIDLLAAIIDRNDRLDIATFSVTEEQLLISHAIAIDCRNGWPPPIPKRGAALSLAGFPDVLQKSSFPYNVSFEAYVYLCFVEDISANDLDIVVTFEPGRDIRVRSAPELTDLGANLSGCSGGPALIHLERRGFHRWFPVGLIVEGPRGPAEGAMAEFDIIRIRRINSIRGDGAICHTT